MKAIAVLLVAATLGAPGVAVACALLCPPGEMHTVDRPAGEAADTHGHHHAGHDRTADSVHHAGPSAPSPDVVGAAAHSCCAEPLPASERWIDGTAAVERDTSRGIAPAPESATASRLLTRPRVAPPPTALRSSVVPVRPPLVLRI
jgi:hypothetical protein